MRPLRPRGIALILTLMVAALLCMLAGAFMGVNEANIRLIGSQEVHNKALQAAQGGVEYAKMRIEHCPEWGDPKVYKPGLAALPNEWPAFQVFETVEGDDDQRGAVYKVVGVLNGGESHFQMLFVSPSVNNISYYPLQDEAGLYTPESIAANPQSPELWAHQTCGNIDISVNNAAARPSDPYLRLDPLNPPTYANATNRTIPPRRSRVLVLGYCKGVTKRVEVSFGPVELSDASLAAGDDMAISMNEGGQWRITASEGENQVKTNGSFYGPTLNAANPDIQFGTQSGSLKATGDIYMNDNVTLMYDDENDYIGITGGGTPLSLAEREAAGLIANGEFKKGSSVVLPLIEAEDVENLAGIADANKKKIAGGRYEFITPNKVRYYATSSSAPVEYTDAIPSSTGGGNAVFLNDGKFIVPNQHQVTVDGSLEIDSTPGIKPKVAIGFTPGGYLDFKAKGVLTVGGNLTVNNGTVVGSGSVVAKGSKTDEKSGIVTIAGKSDMSADPDLGITLFAASSVNITPPTPGNYQKIDFEAFKGAVEGFNGGNWTANKQMNSWNRLDQAEKMALAGNTTASVVNDTVVTAANPAATGSIRTTDISVDLGSLSEENSALNVLVNQYDAAWNDATVMSNLNALIDLYKTGGTGTVGGVELNVGEAGLTPGRYIRIREWLRENQEYHKAGGETVKDTLSPKCAVWADVQNADINENVGQQLIQQIDYYERQRGNYDISSLQSFFGRPKNPITSGSADASFRGLIIANGNIFCDLDDGRFHVDGGMVARRKLAVANAKSVTTNYNPSYMKALTKELYRQKGWRRLSITYWASY